MSFTGQDLGMSLCSCYSSCLTRTCLDFCANSCQHTSLALSDSWPSRGRCPVLSRGKETVGMSIRLLDVCMDMWCGVSMSVCPLMENPGMNLCPGFLYTLCVCACRLNVFLMAFIFLYEYLWRFSASECVRLRLGSNISPALIKDPPVKRSDT